MIQSAGLLCCCGCFYDWVSMKRVRWRLVRKRVDAFMDICVSVSESASANSLCCGG